MKYRCVICSKTFQNRKDLQNHTGTENPNTSRAYTCGDCGQRMCSDRALQQHRQSPSHATRFKCATCNRLFGSENALQAHTNSEVHNRHERRQDSLRAEITSSPSRVPQEDLSQAFRNISLGYTERSDVSRKGGSRETLYYDYVNDNKHFSLCSLAETRTITLHRHTLAQV